MLNLNFELQCCYHWPEWPFHFSLNSVPGFLILLAVCLFLTPEIFFLEFLWASNFIVQNCFFFFTSDFVSWSTDGQFHLFVDISEILVHLKFLHICLLRCFHFVFLCKNGCDCWQSNELQGRSSLYDTSVWQQHRSYVKICCVSGRSCWAATCVSMHRELPVHVSWVIQVPSIAWKTLLSFWQLSLSNVESSALLVALLQIQA